MSETEWLKISLDHTQEDIKRKKEILNELKRMWVLREDHNPEIHILRDEKYPELSWKIIAVDSDSDGDIDRFHRNDETLKSLLRPDNWRSKNKYYLKACDLAWYSELPVIDKETWRYSYKEMMMYKTWDPKRTPIPQDSLEFYLAWEQIAFYSVRMNINEWLMLARRGEANTFDKEIIEIYIDLWELRIDDLLFLKEKEWITDQLYNYALPKVVKLLPKHCSEIRFDKALRDWDFRIHWNLMEENINKIPDDIVDKKTKALCIKIIQSRTDYAERREIEDFITKKKLERERKKTEKK